MFSEKDKVILFGLGYSVSQKQCFGAEIGFTQKA